MLPVHRLLSESLKILRWVEDVGDLLNSIPYHGAFGVLEVGNEENAGNKESAVFEQIGVSESLSNVYRSSIEGNGGVAICSRYIV